MNQKIILISEIILCILVQVIMHLVSHYIYADTFQIRFVVYMFTNWIIITLINWKSEVKTDQPRIRWFTLLLVAITIVIFIIYKPKLTYLDGREIISSQGYGNINELQDKSMISFKLKHTSLVPDAYLYAGVKNNVNYYILLSPINGEIEIEEMGNGNYLDRYFEMKYNQ